MSKIHKFQLSNGLRVIFQRDKSTPMAVVNTLYNVGAKDENPECTGLAHYFEHLMFSGSKNVANFDLELQKAGGQSNAFTSNDITNYYITIPQNRLETALWVESDRMAFLEISDHAMETQRKVVIEEFRQRYLNQPYGDTWMELRPLAFDAHPYHWATIGKSVEHIEAFTRHDIQDFYERFYNPSNAILSIVGNFEETQIEDQVNHWFADLQGSHNLWNRNFSEPQQTAFRKKEIFRNVPACAFYFAFKMPGRMDPSYPAVDLLSDIFGRGKSSILHQKFIVEKEWATEVSSFVLGSHDPGLFIISGKLKKPELMQEVEVELRALIESFLRVGTTEKQLEKVKNKYLTAKYFEELSIYSRALNLATFELLGDLDLAHRESELYQRISEKEINAAAQEVLNFNRCSLLTILPKNDDK